MKPENELVTPKNVEEQIQKVFQTHGLTPVGTRVIRELYSLYRGDEGIMERTWERLVERYPESENKIDQSATEPQKIITLPLRPVLGQQSALGQQSVMRTTVRKSWKQRVNILIAVAVCMIVIASSFFLFHQSHIVPPAHPTVPAKGPLQLLDSHGKLFYQTDGKKTSYFGKDQQTADFVQYALPQLAAALHVKPVELANMGLHVTTTLDLDLQSKVYNNAQQQIQQLRGSMHIDDSAVVVLDYHDGSIRALFGSLNEQQTEGYNVATQNSRQLGSVYKPFVYATAFDQGISPGDIVADVPTTFPGNYMPQNYDQQFHGLISYRTALQNSYNIPAIKLLQKTQIAPTAKKVAELGVPSMPLSQLGYSMALGTSEATVLNTTVAYGTIANQGVHFAPNTIEKVSDTNGRVLFQASAQGTHVLSSAAAFMITDVLRDNTAHTLTMGACSPVVLYTTSLAQCQAGDPGIVRPAAVKTGLDDAHRDNWTVGYTSDYAVGVWSGNDNGEPMVGSTGSEGAAQIWHDTMLMAEGSVPVKPFAGPPATVVKKTVSEQGFTVTDWHLK